MRNIYIFGLFLSITLLSCEKESEINIDNNVINSFISDGTPFVIQASKTVSVFDTATYFSSKDLEGVLYEDGKIVGDLIFQETYTREGLPGEVPEGYSVNGFGPKQGKEYRFELKRGQDVVVSGSDKIPFPVSFTISDTSTVNDESSMDSKGIECSIKFNDTAGEENYYIITYNHTEFMDQYDEIGWTQGTGWMKSDDPAIESYYYRTGLLYTGNRYIFSDKYFDGQEYTMPVSFFVGHDSGRRMNLNIYLLSVSEQYYKYVSSAIKQQENNDDYYAEPTQVYNNINNGFGIFAGFSVSKYIIEFGKGK